MAAAIPAAALNFGAGRMCLATTHLSYSQALLALLRAYEQVPFLPLLSIITCCTGCSAMQQQYHQLSNVLSLSCLQTRDRQGALVCTGAQYHCSQRRCHRAECYLAWTGQALCTEAAQDLPRLPSSLHHSATVQLQADGCSHATLDCFD